MRDGVFNIHLLADEERIWQCTQSDNGIPTRRETVLINQNSYNYWESVILYQISYMAID